MARTEGNRGMWLLKLTSKHHTPERLAWAMALGSFVGLIPKLNLLAPTLYVLILFLPVHTLLAIASSLLVSIASFYLDPLTDGLGCWLLTQPSLSWLWNSIDEMPLVPWLSLHNSVVLGSSVCGLVMLAPCYLVAARLFEYLEYDLQTYHNLHNYSAVPTEESPLVAPPSIERAPNKGDRVKFRTTPPAPAPAAAPVRRDEQSTPLPVPAGQLKTHTPSIVVPPPKFSQSRTEKHPSAVVGPDEPIEFEPLGESVTPINSWHIHQTPGERAPVLATVHASRSETFSAKNANQSAPGVISSESASSEAPQPKSSTPSDGSELTDFNHAMTTHFGAGQDLTTGSIIDKLRSGTTQLGLGNELHLESAWPSDVRTTMEVVQNAAETLAWVDELLDECLANHGLSVVTADSDGRWDTSLALDDHSTGLDEPPQPCAADDAQSTSRWLMETTIEIVRWTEPATADSQVTPRGNESARQNNIAKEMTAVMQPSLLLNELANSQSAAELNILPISTTVKRTSDSGHGNFQHSNFQHLVMATASRPTANPHRTEEPVKGESLGFLIGHLRQVREGKGS